MIVKSNLHCHTNFVDGKNTAEKMAEYAYNMGFVSLGFSEHAQTPCDPEYGLSKQAELEYFDVINKLKHEYRGKMDIFLGLEVDATNPYKVQGLDYTIASLHYMHVQGQMLSVDASPEQTEYIINNAFSGDAYAFTEAYYTALSEFIINYKPDIVGHIDLVTKFNEGYVMFNEQEPIYINQAKDCINNILANCPNVIFELNTGAMSRGYRSSPYPAFFILEHIKNSGAKLCINSDAHSAKSLAYGFEEAVKLLRRIGFTEVWEKDKGFWKATQI